MRNLALTLLLFLPIAMGSFAPAQPYFDESLVLGSWLSENGNQKVEIYIKNWKYFGKVTWLKEDSDGRAMYDSKNPDPSLRGRRITGIDLLRDFYYYGSRTYYGFVYDPVSGSDYKARVILSEDGKTCWMRGYVGIPLFGRTEVCKKV